MVKLDDDQKEDLKDLVKNESIVLLLVEIDNLVEGFERDIIKLSLGSCDEKQLYLRKAHAEGAAKLASAIRAKVQSLKSKG